MGSHFAGGGSCQQKNNRTASSTSVESDGPLSGSWRAAGTCRKCPNASQKSPNLVVRSLQCPGGKLASLVWSGLAWSGLVWPGYLAGVVWSGVVWPGVACSGLANSGPVCPGLVCSGLLWQDKALPPRSGAPATLPPPPPPADRAHRLGVGPKRGEQKTTSHDVARGAWRVVRGAWRVVRGA